MGPADHYGDSQNVTALTTHCCVCFICA